MVSGARSERVWNLFLSIIGAVGLTGCSTVTITEDYDVTEPFPEYQTYAWWSSEPVETGDIRVDNAILDARIRRAVEVELQKKGYEKAPVEQADFHIRYHATVRHRLQMTWYFADYDEGTLVLDVLGGSPKRLQWRGTATTRLHFTAPPELRERRIQYVVRRILARFPPDDR